MDYTPVNYQPLGGRTLFVFWLQSSGLVALIPVPLLLAWFYRGAFASPAAEPLLRTVIMGCLAIWPLLLAVTLLVGWLQYARYGVELDRLGVKISRGLIATDQEGIPYRRIQDVRMHRGLLDQVLGVATVIIAIANEDEAGKSSVVLPAISRPIADQIQKSLLQRAQVEQFHVTGPGADAAGGQNHSA